MIITTMVLSIISAVTLTFYLSLTVFQFTKIDDYNYYYDDSDECGCHDYCDDYTNSLQTSCTDCTNSDIDEWAVTSVQAAIGLAELVVSIVASAICCHAICCCSTNYVAEAPSSGAQYVVVNTQQGPCLLSLQPGYQLAGPSTQQSTVVNMGDGSVDKHGLPPSAPANPSPPPPYTQGVGY